MSSLLNSIDPKVSDMKIVIQTFDFTATNDLELFIATCTQKLLRHTIPIIRAEVILGIENTDVNKRKFCNIRLITAGNGYLVSQYGNTYEEAVTIAVTELETKIQKETDKSFR